MRRGLSTTGFTIVEVLIFLGVSGALLLSALTLIGGQQNKTEFNQAYNDIQKQIEGIINNVGNGYYPSSKKIECTASGNTISISDGTAEQGTQKGCVFLGQTLRSEPTDKQTLIISTIAGLREDTAEKEVTLMAKASPMVATQLDERIRLKNGLKLATIKENDNVLIDGVGFFSSLGAEDAAHGGLESKAQEVNYIGLPTGNVDASFAANYDANKSSTPLVLCFDGVVSNLRAKLWIGENSKGAVITTKIDAGNCS